MNYKFEIPGEPVAKGRPRFSFKGKDVKTYTPKKTVSYENLVKLSFMQQVGNVEPIHKGVYVYIQAYLKIPDSTSKKKREQMNEKEILPLKKPDCDNIAKGILDALNGMAYDDDKQIVSLEVNKFYSDRPRAVVNISDSLFD